MSVVLILALFTMADLAATNLTKPLQNSGEQESFQELNGPYLGQILHGDIPEPFAPSVFENRARPFGLVVSPDFKEIFYTADHAGVFSIFVSILRDGKWSSPLPASFSGEDNDLYPCFSPDGNKIFFSSTRPRRTGEKPTDGDIWVTQRDLNGWEVPQNIGFPVNSDRVSQARVVESGSLYFMKGNSGLHRAILRNGKYVEVEKVSGPFNREFQSGHYWIFPDESAILFESNNPKGHGGYDLWICFRNDLDGSWSAARNLGDNINSPKNDSHPTASPDGKFVFFTSDRSGTRKLYWARTGLFDQ